MKTLRCVYFVLCTAVAGQALGQKTYEEKLSEANELIADGVKSNNKEDLAEGYFRKGKLADGLGNYKEATVWFQKARLLYLEKKPSFELFRVLARLSTVEYQQKHFKEALRLNEEAIKIAEEIDDDKARSMGYSARGRNLAQISLNQDDTLLSYQKVLNDFLLAEKYAKKIRDKAGLHEMYLIYGVVFQSYKKPQKSLELYLKILPDFKKKSFEQPKIFFFLNLAAIYIDLGKLPEAIKILKTIEPIVQNPSYKDFNPKLRFNEVAASYQEASKNYKLANIHYRIMKDMLEKAVAQDNDGQITKLNRQYDLSAKDAEIAQKQVALKAGKKLRNTQYWLLIVSAISLIIMASMMYYLYKLYIKYRHVSARNAMLVHEQNHRVKNNLQVISSMLNIQANMSDDRMITETIHEIKLRIDSMIQLQKQLYAQDLTGFVNLKILINELVQSAMYNFDIFGLNYEAEFIKEEFDMDLSMPLALVINELITNACKYAFKDQALPMLRISVATVGNKIEIEVKDNGLHPIENLKVLSENSSFGFKMINMLLKQIDGNLNYQYESGSKFKIAIKTNGKNQNITH